MRKMFPDIFPSFFRVGTSRRPDIETCSLRRPHPEGVSRGNILSLGVWEMFPQIILDVSKKTMRTTKHILHLSCGVTCTMTFDEETAQMNCEWTPAPPYSLKKIEKIRDEYEPWRNRIVMAWAQRNKRKVMLVTPAPD